MKKCFLAVMVLFVVLILAGCGHNTVVYGDGIGVETTLNPETFTFGLNIRYGKILTACVKEKAEVNLEAGFSNSTGTTTDSTSTTDSTGAKGATSTTSLDSKLSIKTGDQITGYTVDLEKVKSANK